MEALQLPGHDSIPWARRHAEAISGITEQAAIRKAYSVRAGHQNHGPRCALLAIKDKLDRSFYSFLRDIRTDGQQPLLRSIILLYEATHFCSFSVRPRKRRGITRSRSNQVLISPNAHA